MIYLSYRPQRFFSGHLHRVAGRYPAHLRHVRRHGIRLQLRVALLFLLGLPALRVLCRALGLCAAASLRRSGTIVRADLHRHLFHRYCGFIDCDCDRTTYAEGPNAGHTAEGVLYGLPHSSTVQPRNG
ncbi:hypothetical protein OESDEN_05703, partial [Oesophagostomum dentatum]